MSARRTLVLVAANAITAGISLACARSETSHELTILFASAFGANAMAVALKLAHVLDEREKGTDALPRR